jgi:beta-lactamase regulating signal transducer with metallopeptidase domain
MFLPLDLPGIYVIEITRLMPIIYQVFNKPLIIIGSFPVSVFLAITVVWISGSLYYFSKIVRSYYNTHKILAYVKENATNRFDPILSKVLSRYKKPASFRVYETEGVHSPMVFGVRHPVIILSDLKLSDKEWEYIFSHEIAHFYHKDLTIKLVLEIFHSLYWWNPLIHLIKKQLYKLLEINADITVVKQYSRVEGVSYLQCLVKVAKRCAEVKTDNLVVAFQGQHPSVVSRRVYVILNEVPVNRRSFIVSFFVPAVLCLLTMVLPYFVTIAPYGVTEETKRETFEFDKISMFFIQKEDGTYDLYIDGFFSHNQEIAVFDGLQLPIYSSLEEAFEHEKDNRD